MRSLDDSNFGVISGGSGAFEANGLSSTHTGHTLEPAMQLPIGSRHRFCHGFVLVSIEGQQCLHSTPLDSTCQHHPLTTPPWVS